MAFREKTSKRLHLNVLFDDGGLGDNICRLVPLKWLLENQEHLILHIWCPDYFVSFTKHALHEYNKRIVVRGFSQKKKFNPNFRGVRTEADRHSSLSTHLVDYNFSMLADYQPSIKDKNYPFLNLNNIDIKKFKLPHPERYIVLTTAFTAPVRCILPEIANEIIDHIIELGYTPVFVGKEESKVMEGLTLDGKELGGINYDKGLDLRNETSLLECAKVLKMAKLVVGLDNGLLHLAACSDVPIVFGFTNVEPRHRLPYRHNKKGWNCYPLVPDKDVKCRFCQSCFKFAFGQNFAFCYYEDYECIKNMTADKYIKQIDMGLKYDRRNK